MSSLVKSGLDRRLSVSLVTLLVPAWSPLHTPKSTATLLEVQRQLEEAQRLAGIGSWSWDLATDAVHWSAEAHRILGVPLDETPSFALTLSFSPDTEHRDAFLARVQGALAGTRRFDFESRVRLRDGRTVMLHTRGEVVRDADGTPLRMVGTMQDVTAQREAERVLRDSEARFRTLCESSPAGVFLTDADGHPTYVNQRLLDWFNLPAEQLTRERWLAAVHPDDVDAMRAAIDRAFVDRGPLDVEYRVQLHGETQWLRVRTQPVLDADGHTILGHVGSVLNTTTERVAEQERQRLQAQLQQMRQLEMLGVLAGGVAHDFNNLLVGILANASLARQQMHDEGRSSVVLDDIVHAAHRASELTRQLLVYAGQARVERAPVCIASLVKELPTLLGARVPRGVTLLVDVQAEPGVHGDATQLRQVVLNLVTNAVDAIGTGEGQVHITVSQRQVDADTLSRCFLGSGRSAGDYAVVTVQDTGCGMPPDVRERMFDPFFSTKAAGRGLGLAATLGILNSHNGAIDVTSTAGGGTTMRVYVPVSNAPRVTEPPATVAPSFTGSGTVLVVDDEHAARRATCRILERAGFDIVQAQHGAEALELLDAAAEPPVCIVLDLSMPIMDGDECLRTLAARGSTIPVLMVSGYAAEDVVAHHVSMGSATFLQKPFTSDELMRAVQHTLAVAK
jgi:PAS domain S-box-containing protein